MYKLEIKLKQHTPLIHFQHNQEGATLRASEVKPKLDKYILSRLTPQEKTQGLSEGWIKSKNGKTWLGYKMKIEASAFQNVAIPVKPVKKKGVLQTDGIGRQLYSTNNYPDNDSSIIMSNIGGRVEDEVFNLIIANDIVLTIATNDVTLSNLLKKEMYAFFGRTSFGNRISKGFGSYEVKSINGEKEEGYIDSDSYILSFTIQHHDRLKKNDVFKGLFKIINTIWKQLKKLSGVRGKADNNVLLNVSPQNNSGAERIPSPIRFKPLVDFYKKGNQYCCDVNIGIFYNRELISKVSGLQGINHYEDLLTRIKTNIGKNLYEFLSDNLSYDIERSSVNIE